MKITESKTIYLKCSDIIEAFPRGIGSPDLPLIVTGFCFDGNSQQSSRISESSVFEYTIDSNSADFNLNVEDFDGDNQVTVTRILLEPLPVPCSTLLQINNPKRGINFAPSTGGAQEVSNRFHIYFHFTTEEGKPFFCVIDPQLKVQQPPRP